MGKPLYKIGDCVELKTKGPLMTIQEVLFATLSSENVERIGENDTRYKYRCMWFQDGKFESIDIAEEALVLN